jgi:hypothetical protein
MENSRKTLTSYGIFGHGKRGGVILKEHQCPICKRIFKTEYPFAIYCSKKCSQIARTSFK